MPASAVSRHPDAGAARPRLLAVVGPTAAGKTALAIRLARRFDGEVVNTDSRLFYRGVDIGVGKPSADELDAAPHHLLSFLAPADRFGLKAFLDAAHEVIGQITGRGRLPVLAGGTGQYVWALLEGWNVPHVPPDAELRERLERLADEQGAAAVHARLQEVDADAADRIDPRNVRRVIRAIEVASAGGQPAPMKADTPPFDSFVLGLTLPRQQLYARVDARIDAMLLGGWLDEVRRLLGAGVPPTAPAMGSIGYRDLAAHLDGEMGLDEALANTRRATRALVRRQYNWFRLADPRIAWLDAAAGEDAGQRAEAAVEAWLRERPEQGEQS